MLLLLSMLMRHMNSTLIYTLFCFGHERRLALTSVADGLVGLAMMLVLVPLLGFYGAVLGSLTSLALVSLPANLRALAREEGGSPVDVPRAAEPVAQALRADCRGRRRAHIRVEAIRPLDVCASRVWPSALLYAVVMVPVMTTPPLGPMLSARLQPWISRMPRLVRDLAKPASALAR